MADEPARSDVPRRSKAMIAMILAPVFVGGGLVAATVGWYLKVQGTEGVAAGPEVTARFVPACTGAPADQVRDALKARMDDLGLAPRLVASQDGAFTYAFRTPGVQEGEATRLPGVLAAQGSLALSKNGAAIPLTPKDIGVQLAFSGTPVTLMMFGEPLPEEGLSVALDGTPMEVEQVAGFELQLASRAGDSVTALRNATERMVQVRHPLPCAVTVKGT